MKSGKFVCAAIAGLALTSGLASAQLPVLATGGNLVVARSYADSLPTYFLDTHHPFNQVGVITSWEIYASSTEQVQLVIFRESKGVISEVGRSALVTPAVGYNLFQLATPIIVQAGDFIGGNMPGVSGSSNGPVVFSLDAGQTNASCVGTFDLTALLAPAGSTSFICSSDRTYSIRAFGSL
jgi:hypothetical protein